MNDKRKVVPMQVPMIGGGPGQITITEFDTMGSRCKNCNSDLFTLAYRHRILPAVSPKNPQGQDIPIKIEVFICKECGLELMSKLQ